MRRLFKVSALLLSLLVVLGPSLAQARVGGGGSFGSRGGRTYSAPPATGTSPYGAAPMQGSTTLPGGGGYGAGYGTGYGGGFRRSGLGTGLMGGLLGFGLGRMMFGHGYGYGFGGGLGILGLLIRLAIVFFLVRWVFRRFFFASARTAAGGLFASGGGAPAPMPYPGGGGGMPLAPPVAIQPADYAAFEVLLKNTQAAWSNGDLAALRNFASPEMVSVFAEQLADNASRGRRNVVSNVHLDKGDLSEAWAENGRTYATVAMRFSMTDVTYDAAGHVIDGNPSQPVSATEYWTFLRANGGRWMLSAIQQGK